MSIHDHDGHAADHADCSETMYRIMEYVDGEMAAGDMAKIAAHLEACGPCLQEHDLDLLVKSIVKRSCACESAPPQLRSSIIESFSTYTYTEQADGTVVEELTHIRFED